MIPIPIIRQLEERHVASKVDLMVWSSKMDLLALSNTKGEVALHRLTWQKVWSLAPPTPEMVVRKMSWRPDGRVLAVAYVPKEMKVGDAVEGVVILVDVENKETLHTINVSDDVSCVVWLQEKLVPEPLLIVPGSSHSQDGTVDFLPKLPSLSRVFASSPDNSEETHDDSKRVKDQSQLNFLLIGTSDGSIYLSVFGLFSCGVSNINSFMSTNEKDKHTSVLNAELSPDMKSLFVLVAVDAEKFYPAPMKEENEIANKDSLSDSVKEDNTPAALSPSKVTNNQEMHRKRELKIVILDTRVLSSRSRELHALSQKQGHIISLMDYLSETMRSIMEAWENIYLLEIESKLSKHAETLPESSLAADLLELLLFGVPSDSLSDFLMNDINDKAIKKLGQSIELSHSNIQKLILKHLLSVVQNIAYHLAEMTGMAKLTDRFKVLGLEEEAVTEAFSAAGAFLIKATEVQLVIDESMKRYKAFFKWLYSVILKFADDRVPELTMSDINQEDLNYIADYLQKLDIKTDDDGVTKRHCFLDRLGQYLDNQDLTSPIEGEADNHWQKLLEANPCLKNHYSIKSYKNTSLVQQHEQLTKSLSKVFRTPEYAIGNMFQLKKIVDIAETSFKKVSMGCVDDSTIFLSYIKVASPLVFYFVKISAEGNNCEHPTKTVSFKAEDNVVMQCLDIQFYHSEFLSALFEEQDENKNAVIAQVKTKNILENDSDIIDANILKDCVVTRPIPDFVASSFAVSATRKVAVVLSLGRRKVRLFEMEAEDDDEDEEISPTDPTPPATIGEQKEESLSDENGVLVVKLRQNDVTVCEEDSFIEIECS